VRGETFGEDLQPVRTGNQPNAHAASRNLVTGAFRRAGFANIAHTPGPGSQPAQPRCPRTVPAYGCAAPPSACPSWLRPRRR
jgi:hypothetical protein